MAAQIFADSIQIDTSGVAETTLKEITPSVKTKVSAIWVDADDSDDILTVKVYHKVDGANYRQIVSYDMTINPGESVNILAETGGFIEIDEDFKVTLTATGGGAGNKDIFYRIPYDNSVDKLQSVFNGTGAADDVDIQARSVEVDNDAGVAVTFQSTGGNGEGLQILGHGTGKGMSIRSGVGANADALFIQSQAASGTGDAVRLVGAGDTGDGIRSTGASAGHGCELIAGATGNGLDISTTNGKGINIVSAGANGIGINVDANTIGLKIDGATFGVDIIGGTNDGLRVGSISSDGVFAYGGTNKSAIRLLGHGTAHGLQIAGGVTGDGINIAGGATSGEGIYISTTLGSGIKVEPTDGTGIEIIAAGAAGKGVYIESNNTTALDIKSNLSGPGVQISAAGAVVGVAIYGGPTGNGMNIVGGGTSGEALKLSTTDGHGLNIDVAGAGKDGIHIDSDAADGVNIQGGSGGNGDAVHLLGGGNGAGLNIDGGTTGVGVDIAGGGTSGIGLKIVATIGDAVDITTANGHGIDITAGTGGHGVDISGHTTGDGVHISGGATSGDGIQAIGGGTGHGIHGLSGSGATGDGVHAESAATNGNGISAIGTGTENGLKLDAANTGKGIEINQYVRTTQVPAYADMDIFELMYSMISGKRFMSNTGGANEVEIELWNYGETSKLKTLQVQKPDGTDLTENVNVKAMAGAKAESAP